VRLAACLGFLLGLLAFSIGSLAHAAPASEPPSAPAVDAAGVPVVGLLRDNAALVAWLGQRSPELAAAGSRVKQARALLEASRAWQNPTLNLGVDNLTVGTRNPANLSYSDTLAYQVGLSQTFEIGKRGPRVRAASYRSDAALEGYRDSFGGLVNDAREVLGRVVYLSVRQRILDERLDSAQRIAEVQKARLDRGDMSGIDYDRLVLDAAQVQEDVADNRTELEAGLADCASLLMASCAIDGAAIDAVDSTLLAPANVDDLDRAVLARPDLRALRLSQRAASEEATLFRRQAIPDPTLGVNYTRDYLVVAGNQPHSFGVSASIPLPIFNTGHYQALEAEQRAQELGFEARSLEHRAAVGAKSLVLRLGLLQGKLDTIDKQALPRSSEVVKSSGVAYERGQISLTDLLLARREHASLLLEEAETRFALFTVRNALRRTLGLDAPASVQAHQEN
jgi:outer membrane protein, heavy metal efflux system